MPVRTEMLMLRVICALGAAIVLIVLSLAPSVAQAHVLHRHHVIVHAHGDHAQAAFDASSPSKSTAVLQQAQPNQAGEPASSDSDRNCVGACCASVCAACCAAGLPASVQFVPLSRLATRVAFAVYRFGPDRAPESLKRPPRPFI
ncbi:MAG: hypothetical protein ABW175_04845 [Bradyrhizobium sp.]